MLCLAILGGTMNFATAQNKTKEKPTAEEMATKRTEKLTEALKLTDSQKEQVYSLILNQSQEREKINNTKLTQDERHTAMKELNASFDDKLKSVLTADQLKTYEAHKADMKNKKQGHHGQGGHQCGGNCSHGSGGCSHGSGSK